MIKRQLKINNVEDMKRFILHSAKVPEPGVSVYRGYLSVDGGSVIAMMNLINIPFTVEYSSSETAFDSFVKQFLI